VKAATIGIHTLADYSVGLKERQQLIKDYELEVHYHPGKANIIADVLSCKAHCNYLVTV
jgi:hypothetical protein